MVVIVPINCPTLPHLISQNKQETATDRKFQESLAFLSDSGGPHHHLIIEILSHHMLMLQDKFSVFLKSSAPNATAVSKTKNFVPGVGVVVNGPFYSFVAILFAIEDQTSHRTARTISRLTRT